ncbi:phospholipase A [Bowmanella pacifica]|uniref:Phospholipase A1 n=1 Tax=Bowmanella pacifica TaxID=502051 RepID=A0A918DFQ6_9ALTE|nr:phospholipase A [Bowmanella pacifica]GGO64283.1 phospholipase [Bowmanella pacifica]
MTRSCLLILCLIHGTAFSQTTDTETADDTEQTETLVTERLVSDKAALINPYAITQHKPNYLLPFSYQKNPNQLGEDGFSQGNVEHMEAKFQISVKMPIYRPDETSSLEGLYFGFTAKSMWQVYNSEVSKPFRETNYQPEIFYNFDADVKLLGYQFNLAQIGMEHQSNGQNQLRSRSWNRIYGSLLFSDQDSYYYLRAWYRIKEDKKEDPLDPRGDDNPDITHFLGHMEVGYGTQMGNFKLMTMIRNNLKTSDNKGSIELNLTYPINDRYEILLQYFNGYGDSLIDYNRHQQRISLGIQLAYF